MDRFDIIQDLLAYQSSFTEEQLFVPRFLSLINNFENCFDRSLDSGHITGSSWITDVNASSVLLVFHKKLKRWLQPGGHADGVADIQEVSKSEAKEETGLNSLQLISPTIFDLDIHQIPAHKGIKAHLHYDIRYLFQADMNEELVISDESTDLKWFDLDQVDFYAKSNPSIQRMILKTKLIFKSRT